MTELEASEPSPFAYVLSFLVVGLCWGFTTPFIRRAALTYTTPTHPSITDPRHSWLSRQIAKAFFTVLGLLKSPGYAVPLLCNLTGSVWFFLLVGKAGKNLRLCLSRGPCDVPCQSRVDLGFSYGLVWVIFVLGAGRVLVESALKRLSYSALHSEELLSAPT